VDRLAGDGLVFLGWMGYAWFARHYGVKRSSLLGTTNRYRHYWLLQATARDPRVIDGIITQNLSSTPAFFSSTTIIIIGGLFALLGTTDKAAELVREIPFAVRTSVLIFDLKVLLMVAVFVYAFFRFSWSMRQYTFVALLIGSMPSPQEFEVGKFDREAFATRSSRMVGLAAETFNDGLAASAYGLVFLLQLTTAPSWPGLHFSLVLQENFRKSFERLATMRGGPAAGVLILPSRTPR
jgi:uncharacterized membrane protein